MPIYEYYCKKCGEESQEVRGISEEQKVTDCKCGETLTRKYGFGTVTFNGNGFYSTDKKEK